MKPEEAIENLRERIDLAKKVWTNVPGIVEYRKALELAVKALKKQIPMKVLYEDVGYDFHRDVNLYACICPSCGLHIIEFSDIDVNSECNSDSPEDMFRSSMVHHAYIGMNNYCNRCGQKLDWGEENGR
nr:MAG TPA: Thaumarchaeal output domain 1 [Caudoviricetes sp.]